MISSQDHCTITLYQFVVSLQKQNNNMKSLQHIFIITLLSMIIGALLVMKPKGSMFLGFVLSGLIAHQIVVLTEDNI